MVDETGSAAVATVESADVTQGFWGQQSEAVQSPETLGRLPQGGPFVAPISFDFLHRAASPGVLLQALQHHMGDLNAMQCSLAYARLAELCRGNLVVLQQQYTQQLLELLQWELPRLAQQQQLQLRHIAQLAAAGLSLQQPQLVRIMLQQLQQHPQRRDPVQQLCSVVACIQLQQLGLAKGLLRALLSEDQVLAPKPVDARRVATLAGLTDKPLPQQQQQQLLSMLLAETDMGSVQQVAVAFWAACSTLPGCESEVQELLGAFVQLLQDATALAIMLVLSCVQAAEWEPVPWRLVKQVLLAAEQLLPGMTARQIASILVCTSRQNFDYQFGERLHVFLDAFVERLPTATVSDICGVCWAVAIISRRLRSYPLGLMLERVVQQLPAVTPKQANLLLWSMATMRVASNRGDCVQQLVAVALRAQCDSQPVKPMLTASCSKS